MVSHEKWLTEEYRGQKWRRLTPLLLVIVGCILTALLAEIGFVACLYIQANASQTDSLAKALSNFESQNKLGQDKLWNAFTDFKKCENQSMADCGCKKLELCYDKNDSRGVSKENV